MISGQHVDCTLLKSHSMRNHRKKGHGIITEYFIVMIIANSRSIQDNNR
jgi:hypothetical protein